jgi:hypothetical protein
LESTAKTSSVRITTLEERLGVKGLPPYKLSVTFEDSEYLFARANHSLNVIR